MSSTASNGWGKGRKPAVDYGGCVSIRRAYREHIQKRRGPTVKLRGELAERHGVSRRVVADVIAGRGAYRRFGLHLPNRPV